MKYSISPILTSFIWPVSYLKLIRQYLRRGSCSGKDLLLLSDHVATHTAQGPIRDSKLKRSLAFLNQNTRHFRTIVQLSGVTYTYFK